MACRCRMATQADPRFITACRDQLALIVSQSIFSSGQFAPIAYLNLLMRGETAKWQDNRDFWIAVGLSLIAALMFAATTKDTMHDFDYTARIGSALLQGHVGLDRQPGSWLNEMVPFEGKYYSVFPLGAVLSVLPVAILQKYGWVHIFPARVVGELIVALCFFFFFRLAIVETKSLGRRILLALFPIFGS